MKQRYCDADRRRVRATEFLWACLVEVLSSPIHRPVSAVAMST